VGLSQFVAARIWLLHSGFDGDFGSLGLEFGDQSAGFSEMVAIQFFCRVHNMSASRVNAHLPCRSGWLERRCSAYFSDKSPGAFSAERGLHCSPKDTEQSG
jgi:hypothetical protein